MGNDIKDCIFKVFFETEEIAINRLKNIIANDPQTELKRIYQCNRCEKWHLTKQALKLTVYDIEQIEKQVLNKLGGDVIEKAKNYNKLKGYIGMYKKCTDLTSELMHPDTYGKKASMLHAKLKSALNSLPKDKE